MKPDFATLKPVEEKPDFASLKPVETTPVPEPEKGLLTKLGGRFGDAFDAVKNIATGERTGLFTVPEALINIGGAGAGAINDVFSAALSPVVDKTADLIFDIPAVQKIAQTDQVGAVLDRTSQAFSQIGEEYQEIAEKYPRTAKLVESVGNIVSLMTLKRGGGIAAETKAGQAVQQSVKELMTPTEAAVDRYITETFERAVKPSITNKKTLERADLYKGNVIKAVDTIAKNKDNLTYTLEDGTVEAARLPKNLNEFSNAIDQTKKTVFQQYNDLAKQAGQKGVTISTEQFGKTLDEVINNEALQFSHPEAVKYAQDLKARLAKNKLPDGSPMGYKEFDAETAQAIIKNYNSSLEAFYRNPTYDSASKAAIDAALVNNMRKALDEAIEGATGKEYQALKRQYGALKAIESDVVKRANVVARQNAKGLIDYTDIFSGGDIASGILTLNPALFARGVAQKTIKEWFKSLNDPNRAIQKMFERAEVETRASGVPVGLSIKAAGVPKGMTDSDLVVMRDYTDMINGAYKPSPEEAALLREAMQDIADKYKLKAATKGDKALSFEAAQILDAAKFSETLP